MTATPSSDVMSRSRREEVSREIAPRLLFFFSLLASIEDVHRAAAAAKCFIPHELGFGDDPREDNTEAACGKVCGLCLLGPSWV